MGRFTADSEHLMADEVKTKSTTELGTNSPIFHGLAPTDRLLAIGALIVLGGLNGAGDIIGIGNNQNSETENAVIAAKLDMISADLVELKTLVTNTNATVMDHEKRLTRLEVRNP